MSFARVKPSDWASGEVLTSTQMNQLDTNVSQAIDGTAGGTYAPTDPIIIGGDGISVTGALTGLNTATFGGTSMTSIKAAIPSIRSTYEYILPMMAHTIGADWTASSGSYSATAVSGGSPARFLTIPIGPLPRHQADAAMYLKEVMIVVQGGAGHGGVLPNTMPKLSLWRVIYSGGSTQVGSTSTDSSASAAAYEGEHSIFCSVSHQIELFMPGGALYLILENEFGGSAQVGLRIIGAKAVVSATP